MIRDITVTETPTGDVIADNPLVVDVIDKPEEMGERARQALGWFILLLLIVLGMIVLANRK